MENLGEWDGWDNGKMNMGAGKYIVYTFYLLFTRACVCVCSHTNACLDLCGYQRTTSGRQFSPSLMCALVTIIRSR